MTRGHLTTELDPETLDQATIRKAINTIHAIISDEGDRKTVLNALFQQPRREQVHPAGGHKRKASS